MKKSTLKRLVQLLDDEVVYQKELFGDQESEVRRLNESWVEQCTQINKLHDEIEEYRTRQRPLAEILEAIEILMLPETVNNKIFNIKAVRCLTGKGLKDAKEFVEMMFERRKTQELMIQKKTEEQAFLDAEGMSFEVS